MTIWLFNEVIVRQNISTMNTNYWSVNLQSILFTWLINMEVNFEISVVFCMYLHGVFDICTLIKSFLSHMTDNWEVTSKLVVLHPFVSIDEIFQVNLLLSSLTFCLNQTDWRWISLLLPSCVLCMALITS